MTSEVGLVLRVNTAEAAKLSSAVDELQRQNKALLRDAEAALKIKEKELAAAERAANKQKSLNNEYTVTAALLRQEAEELAHALALQRSLGDAALQAAKDRERAAAQEIANSQRRYKAEAASEEAEAARIKENAAALQAFKIKTLGENAAAEQAAERRALAADEAENARLRANAAALQAFKIRTIGENVEAELEAHRKIVSADDAEKARIKENAAALQAFKIRTIGENVEAEIAAQRKLDRLHTQAIIEDRERTRRAQEERRKAAAAAIQGPAQFGAGALSVAGLGFGANALGAGISAALLTGYASKVDIDLERTKQALSAVNATGAQTEQQFQFIAGQASRLGVNVRDMAFQFAQFTAASKGTKLEGEQATQVFLSVVEASQKLGLRSDEAEGAMRALGQMMSKGKVQAEELRGQLGDRLTGAFQLFAKGAGLSTSQLDALLQKGGVISEEMLPGFGRALRDAFGTDANTRIETTIAKFTRLRNEIDLQMSQPGSLINSILGPGADGISSVLQRSREGATFDAQYGFLDRPQTSDRSQPQNEYNPYSAEYRARIRRFYEQQATVNVAAGTTGFDFSAGVLPKLKADSTKQLSGIDLLTSGQRQTSDKEQREINALLKQTIAANRELTEVEKARAQIEEGLYADKPQAYRDALLGLAAAKDKAKVDKDAATEAKQAAAAQLQFDKAARAEAERDATRVKELIRDQMARNAALSEELATGEKVTNSRKRALQIQYEQADVSGRSRDAEMDAGDELERQLGLRREARQLTEEALRVASRNARRGRNGGGDARSYAEIEAETRGKIEDERERYRLQSQEATAAGELELYEDHQRNLTQIAREGEEARLALTRSRAEVAAGIFGNLANASQMFGERGFKAYKAFAIAEATASMISGAVGAFSQASKTYPPPFGQVMGGIAAGAVVASGIAQIAQIRSLSYGGGREMGGVVNERSFYEVGERGRPELYEQDGKLYMIPGNNGRVTPAGELGAAQGKSGVVVNNYGGARVEARQLSDGQILVEVDKRVSQGVNQARNAARSDRMRDLESVGPETRYRQSREGTRTRPSRRRF